MTNHNNSGIVTTGNFKRISSGNGNLELEFSPVTSQTEDKDTVDVALQRVKNYAYYIHSRDIDDRIIADDITEKVKRLPRMQAAAVFYRYGMDLTQRQVAEQKMHCDQAAVNYHLQRALKNLKAMYEAEFTKEER